MDQDKVEDVNTIMLRNPMLYAVIIPSCMTIIPSTLAVAIIYLLQR